MGLPTPNDLVYASATSYVKAVKAFCSGDVDLKQLARGLAHLYSEVLSIDQPELVAAKNRDTSVPHDEWKQVHDGLQGRLPANAYHAIFDGQFEWNTEPEVTAGSLADDFADVWRDVTGYVRSIEAGTLPSNALWQLWHDFHSHWSRQAVDALAALNRLDLR